MRFHVPGLPHLPTSKTHCACAYSQKVLNFCKMLTSLGHDVFHYGVEGSEVQCTEHITVRTQAEVDAVFGPYDYRTQLPNHLVWDGKHRGFRQHNLRAATAILERAQPKDFLCLIAGTCQQLVDVIANHDQQMLTVEYGIGYDAPFAKFRVYESYAHMNKHYGLQDEDPDGNWYHVVIPNSYDPDDFPKYPGPRRGHCLFVGRMIPRKGLEVAVRATEAAGCALVLAGQGATVAANHDLVVDGATYNGGHIHYVGHVDVARRAELMSQAEFLLAPTLYLEPFGGVAVEAQFCGTPVISTDWGAFPETVAHGHTGFRCRTLEQFVWAIKNRIQLSPPDQIRTRAIHNWSIYNVRHMYAEYFQMLHDLWDQGWDTARDRCRLDWLNRHE